MFREFDASSWAAWNSVEDALFGVEPADPALVRRMAGGRTLPTEPVAEGWAVISRGGGKSRVAARLAAYFGAGREYRRAPGEFVYVGIFGPDRKQSALTFRYVRGLLYSVPALAALVVRDTADSIELSTGVVVEVITASTAAPRGRAYALVIIEEAAFLPVDEHGADTDRELVRAVRPALARVPGSLLFVISSPYAMRGEVYRVWREKYGADDPSVLVVQADTATMNPTFSAGEIARAYAEDPESAAAEYGGQFRRDVADLFGPALADVVDPGVRERAPEPVRLAVAHFDGAMGSGDDDAALAVAWTDDEGRGVLAALRRWEPPFSPVSVVQEAAALLARYGVDELQIDRFAPGLFADLFAARGITCAVAERDTSATFLELLAYVNADRVRLLDDEVLLGQLRSLERRTRAGGRDAVGHRPRGHDDVAAAAAGALVLAAQAEAEVPFMLVGGSAWNEWQERHQTASNAEPASDAGPGLIASAVARVKDAAASWRERRQAARDERQRARQEKPRLVDVAKAVIAGDERDAGRTAARWALDQREQAERDERAERARQSAAFIERAVREHGAFFPHEWR